MKTLLLMLCLMTYELSYGQALLVQSLSSANGKFNIDIFGNLTISGSTNNSATTVSNGVWSTAGTSVASLGWTNTTPRCGDMTISMVATSGVGTGYGAVLTVTNWDGSTYSPVQWGMAGLTGLSESGSNSWTFPISTNCSAGVTITAGTVVWGTPASIKWK